MFVLDILLLFIASAIRLLVGLAVLSRQQETIFALVRLLGQHTKPVTKTGALLAKPLVANSHLAGILNTLYLHFCFVRSVDALVCTSFSSHWNSCPLRCKCALLGKLRNVNRKSIYFLHMWVEMDRLFGQWLVRAGDHHAQSGLVHRLRFRQILHFN